MGKDRHLTFTRDSAIPSHGCVRQGILERPAQVLELLVVWRQCCCCPLVGWGALAPPHEPPTALASSQWRSNSENDPQKKKKKKKKGSGHFLSLCACECACVSVSALSQFFRPFCFFNSIPLAVTNNGRWTVTPLMPSTQSLLGLMKI